MVTHSQPAPVPEPEPEAREVKRESDVPQPEKKPRFSITIVGGIPM